MNRFEKVKYSISCLFFCVLLSVQAFAADAAPEEPSEFLLFLGRFHPLVVHLPIGFLLIGFLLECFSRLQQFREVRHATSLVLLLGTVSAVMAALLGYFLSFEGGYDDEALFWHQWLGIGVAITAAVAYFLKLRTAGKPGLYKKAYFPVLTVSMLALTLAGHLGGNLTHGSEYLTQYMPSTLRAIAGMPARVKTASKPITNIEEAVLYTDIIHPIFEERCISCHNPDKKKGDLLMRTYQELMKGGEGGKAIVANQAAQSDLYKRLLLPLEDDDHMPPKGKKQLTKAQIELIRWWINEGASPDKKVAEAKVSEPVKEALARLGVPAEDEGKPTGIFAVQVPEASPGALASVEKAGFMVMPIAHDNHYLQVKFTGTTGMFGLAETKALQSLLQQITWLDLSNTKIADEAVEELSKFVNLTRLRIDNTNISDASLVSLHQLYNLEYLNMYGTAVTDQGLEKLVSLKNLKSLYLWQTKVSTKGVEVLKEKLPKLTVNLGWKQNEGLAALPADSVIRAVSNNN